MKFSGKKVLVYGLGRSGLAAVKLLHANGAEVFVYDDDRTVAVPENTTLVSDAARAADECDLTVLSPAVGINSESLARAREAYKVTGELELACGFLNSELIAVSGTNGKTTVTLLINEIINRAGYVSYALGNIGIPLSEKVMELTPANTAVVEVSTFQLETAERFCPDIALLTNVTSDHIDRHGSLAEYINLKAKLFAAQQSCDTAIINADDETSAEIAKRINSDVLYFSAKKKVRGAYVENGEIVFEDKIKARVAKLSEINASGYNLENALAAVAACMVKGVNPEIIRMVLKAYRPPEYRCEYIGEKRGKRFYNDSKGTNVAATLAAVKNMDGNTVLILGGRGKGENYAKLFDMLPKNVIHAFVTGENAADVTESALLCGWYNISHRATLDECVREASLVRADNVLFSPAAASFDRYGDYRERGKDFTRLFCEL